MLRREGPLGRCLFIKTLVGFLYLFKLGLNLEAPFLNLFMKGVFKEVPPSVDDRMPKGGC